MPFYGNTLSQNTTNSDPQAQMSPTYFPPVSSLIVNNFTQTLSNTLNKTVDCYNQTVLATAHAIANAPETVSNIPTQVQRFYEKNKSMVQGAVLAMAVSLFTEDYSTPVSLFLAKMASDQAEKYFNQAEVGIPLG